MSYILKYDIPKTGIWTFEFNSYLQVTTGFPFKIQSIGDFEKGYEDEDELTIFPSTLEMVLVDRDWINYDRFKQFLAMYELGSQFTIWDFEVFNLKIYRGDTPTLYKHFILDSVKRNPKDNSITLIWGSGINYLGKIRIDNPYLILKLMDTGSLEAEQLKNTAGTVYGGGWAFGGISSWGSSPVGSGYRGFTILNHNGHKTIDLSLAGGETYDLRLATPDRERKIGKVKIVDFIEQGLKLLNDDMQFDIKHDWKFGPHEKEIKDLFGYDIYASLFGCIVILTKGVWNDLGDGISDASKFYFGQAALDKFEKVFDNDKYIAFKINADNLPWRGSGERMLLTHLKAFCKNFFSQIELDSLHKTTMFKKGYSTVVKKNESQIYEYEDESQTNKIKYVKVTFRGRSAERGKNDYAVESNQKLEYEVFFCGKFSNGVSFSTQGGGGVFPPGVNISITFFINSGNLFYEYDDAGTIKRQFGLTVKDERFGDYENIIELLAEIEFRLRKNNRDLCSVSFNDIDEIFTTLYEIIYRDKFSESGQHISSEYVFKYCYPLKSAINIWENEVKFNMIETQIIELSEEQQRAN